MARIPLDPTLKALTVVASAGTIGCSWCMDLGYWETTGATRGAVPGRTARPADGLTDEVLFIRNPDKLAGIAAAAGNRAT